MSNKRNNKTLLGSSVLLALTSSLCCIVPILAVVGSAGSAITVLNRVASLRPYLLAATGLVLGFAFYRAYKPKSKDECGCEEKKNVLQSKSFLWLITVITVLISSFPYYAKYFQHTLPPQSIAGTSNIQQAVLHIEGMNCEACEGHVSNALLKKNGVKNVTASYSKGEATIKFDSTQISLRQLSAAIENETDYKVVNK